MAWNSTVLSPFCSRSQKSFTRLKPWCLGKNAFPWLFQLLEATCVPWLLAPSSIFRMHHSRLFSHHHTLFLSAVSLPLGKDLCDYIGPTPKSLITPAKSLLPYEVNFTVSRIRNGWFWGLVQLTTGRNPLDGHILILWARVVGGGVQTKRALHTTMAHSWVKEWVRQSHCSPGQIWAG